ncbi:MAG: hypothetical protein RSB04_12225 [Gordonibacter sp.]|uniref:hypothetical protein n=1 Tax=Gordonibacter sp. TaxID=1968902 RepID=UPI002FC6FCA0
MTAKGPVTDTEREFVRSMFPQLGVAKIAEKLGRSRPCINNIVRAENLREKCKQQAPPDNDGSDAPDSALSRLKELREMLRRSIKEASAKEMPGLAREYRATVELIDKMEGGSEDDTSAAFDTLAKSIAQRMSS